MKDSRRIFYTVLLVALALTLAGALSACGGSETTTTTTVAVAESTTTTQAESTTTTTGEPIDLTFAGLWPPDHPFSKATELWIEKINKETNGRVTIEPFWGGALYASQDSATELGQGVADIGDFSGAYAADGFGFEKAMRMAFWGVDDPVLARKVYDEVLAKYPELEQEFTDANIKVMAFAGIPPYQLLTVGTAVRTADDFKGLMIKGSGDLAKLASTLGGEGVGIGMGETYTALQKVTIDGAFAPYETLQSFRFAEVVDYATQLDIGAAPSGHWGMNLDTWNSLPPDVQKVFEDNIEWFGLKCEELLRAQDEAAVELAKQNGVEFIQPSAADVQKVYDFVDTLTREQMTALDAQGLPGTQVYEDIRSLITKYGG
ncbi:MAG: TRAP transporter substrate-binding protein DctP [Thermoleophilia bacterium]